MLKLRVPLFAVLLGVALGAVACGNEKETTTDTSSPASTAAEVARSPEIGKLMRAVIAAGVPGVLVQAYVGESSAFASAGVANRKTGDKIGADDLFRVASIAKAFSAAIALALVEDGKLNLNSKISAFSDVAKLLPNASEVTITQLLQHTSGLPDYTKQPSFLKSFQADPLGKWQPQELLEVVTKLPLEFKPGSKYTYSDTDNIAIGLIAEQASGKSYTELLKTLVTEPLGMGRTSLPEQPTMQKPFISGYQYDEPDGKKPLVDVTSVLSPTGAWASGAIISTAAELPRFFSSVRSGRLFGSKLADEQIDTVPGESSPPGPGENGSGLGIYSYKQSCGTVYGHSGSFPGYQPMAFVSKDSAASAVVTINATQISGEALSAVRDLQAKVACAVAGG